MSDTLTDILFTCRVWTAANFNTPAKCLGPGTKMMPLSHTLGNNSCQYNLTKLCGKQVCLSVTVGGNDECVMTPIQPPSSG